MTAKKHPVAMRFIPDHLPREVFSSSDKTSSNNHVEPRSETLHRQSKR